MTPRVALGTPKYMHKFFSLEVTVPERIFIPKSKLGYILEGLEMDIVGHLVYIVDIWYI
jgi:hypothetical protein